MTLFLTWPSLGITKSLFGSLPNNELKFKGAQALLTLSPNIQLCRRRGPTTRWTWNCYAGRWKSSVSYQHYCGKKTKLIYLFHYLGHLLSCLQPSACCHSNESRTEFTMQEDNLEEKWRVLHGMIKEYFRFSNIYFNVWIWKFVFKINQKLTVAKQSEAVVRMRMRLRQNTCGFASYYWYTETESLAKRSWLISMGPIFHTALIVAKGISNTLNSQNFSENQ